MAMPRNTEGLWCDNMWFEKTRVIYIEDIAFDIICAKKYYINEFGGGPGTLNRAIFL